MLFPDPEVCLDSRLGSATQRLQPSSVELTNVGTNSVSAAIFDRYSTRIAKRIAGGCSKSPRDQDLYWLTGRPSISHRRRRLGTFISSSEVLLSNQGPEHNLRVAFAGNLPRRVNDPNSSAESCPLLTLIPTDSPAPKFTAFFLFEFASLLFSLLRLSHSWSKFRFPRGSGAKKRQTAAKTASDHRLIEALSVRERKQRKT